jgi:hypothetical protein
MSNGGGGGLQLCACGDCGQCICDSFWHSLSVNDGKKIIGKTKPSFSEITVISGGQTGADLGALIGAKSVGIKTGGFVRANAVGHTAHHYDLVEVADLSHTARDKKNVDAADLVVAFLIDKPMTGRGTRNTIKYALGGTEYRGIAEDSGALLSGDKCDVVVFWDATDDKVQAMAANLNEILHANTFKTIMFCGPIESTSPGIQRTVASIVATCFSG